MIEPAGGHRQGTKAPIFFGILPFGASPGECLTVGIARLKARNPSSPSSLSRAHPPISPRPAPARDSVFPRDASGLRRHTLRQRARRHRAPTLGPSSPGPASLEPQAETNPVKGIQNVSLSPFRRSGDVFDPNVDVPHQMWHCASWWIIRASSMVANVQCACAMPMANASSLQVSLGSIDRRNYRSELSELSEPSHYRSYRSYRSGLDSVR